MSSSFSKLSLQNLSSWLSMPLPASKTLKSSHAPLLSPQRRTISPEDREELDGVLEMIRERMGNSETIILTVVKREQEAYMQDLLSQSRKANGSKGSEVITATPENLQAKIDEIVGATYTTLYLIVDSAVNYISYNISNVVKNVYIAPYDRSPAGERAWLHIGGSSTFCGIKAARWDSEIRDESLRRHRHTFEEGCCIDLSEEMDGSNFLGRQLEFMVSLSAEDLDSIRAVFTSFEDKFSASSTSGDTEAWLKKWGAILATVFDRMASCVGDMTGGSIWYGARGIYVKGPLGLFLYTCFSGRESNGAVITGKGTSILSATAVHFFIPWDMTLELVKHSLREIWDHIREVFAWIVSKIKEWADNLASYSRMFVRVNVHKPVSLAA